MRFFEGVLRHKILVLSVFLIAAVICGALAGTVSVNYNMEDYLPEDTASTIGLEVMESEYHQAVPNTRVMIPEVSIPEALEYKEKLSRVDGVEEINWLDDAVSLEEPLETLDADTVKTWYKDGNAIFTLALETSKQVGAVNEIREIIGDNGAISGASVNTAVATTNTGAELSKIMVLVVAIVFLILLLTTSSWFEPVLFLITIGIAILLNMGTNVLLGEISFVTKAAGSILQLAVSMDYSIFLLHRFAELRKEGLNVQSAMVNALKKSFSSITASGVTTVIGFAALILMRFKIGPDMGWVMAKGILFSLISVLILLPVMGILFYKLIDKTHHRSFMPELKNFRGFVAKAKTPVLILFIVLVVPSFLAQSSNTFMYGSSNIFSDPSSQLVQDRERIEEIFGKSNQMILMVPRGDLADEKALSDAVQEIPEVTSVISYVDSVGAVIPLEYVPESKLSKLVSENYSRMILTVKTEYEGEQAFSVVEEIRNLAGEYYDGGYYLVGESVSTYDMKDVVTSDNMVVNLIAIGAVAAVLLISFKSLSLPMILVLVIESSIWLNLSVPYYMDTPLFYIAYLIISSVQLGATVDYAILFTNRYMENRRSLLKTAAVKQTIADTTISILTSASILTAGGLMLGAISSNGVLSQIGVLIGRGAVLSALFVLFVLPALLSVMDGFIRRTTMNCEFIHERKSGK